MMTLLVSWEALGPKRPNQKSSVTWVLSHVVKAGRRLLSRQ